MGSEDINRHDTKEAALSEMPEDLLRVKRIKQAADIVQSFNTG